MGEGGRGLASFSPSPFGSRLPQRLCLLLVPPLPPIPPARRVPALPVLFGPRELQWYRCPTPPQRLGGGCAGRGIRLQHVLPAPRWSPDLSLNLYTLTSFMHLACWGLQRFVCPKSAPALGESLRWSRGHLVYTEASPPSVRHLG